MSWKNEIKRIGNAVKRGAIIVAKEIERSERARRERVSVLRLLSKEELEEIIEKFDISIPVIYEQTRDVYINSVAESLSLDEIETALIHINADERAFKKIKDIRKDRKRRKRIVKKRFLKSKDKLRKAMEAVGRRDWPEVLNHIRTAIDLALKERFGFKRIHPMSKFIEDAKSLGFLLPSYDGIYIYFDYGSKRLHDGLIHTPLEAENSLNFVKKFIDELNTIEVSEKELNEFKSKCKAVK